MRRGIAAVLLLFAATAAAQSERSDAYLQGYIAAILERELGWSTQNYDLRVEQGAVTLGTRNLSEDERERARQRIAALRDVARVTLEGAVVAENWFKRRAKQAGRALGVAGETDSFPAQDVFRPLIADEKQPRFFVSLRYYNTPSAETTVGAVGYGEVFGLLRIRDEDPKRNEGLQFSIAGGLFAQFDLAAPSSDLINADYTIGLQTTYRRGVHGARLRFYHQSSHLGDEFLLRTRLERENLSYESLEFLYALSSRDDRWRSYLGGEFLLRREPQLDRASVHGGIEYQGDTELLPRTWLVGGLDLKAHQESDWSVDKSLKLGVQFGQAPLRGRGLRLMGEAYRGYSPHGQFYRDKINYLGLGLYLRF